MSERQATTHHYTRRSWGHDYAVHRVDGGGTRLWASGWGAGIREGHYLVLPNGEATARYRVKAIRYERDPRDMWWADLVFAPREEDTMTHPDDLLVQKRCNHHEEAEEDCASDNDCVSWECL